MEKLKRKYYSESFDASDWKQVEGEYKKLLILEIGSAEELILFWQRVSELEKMIEDALAWLYIRMTQYADNKEHKDAFNNFMATIGAGSQKYSHKLKIKFFESPFREQLGAEYEHLNRIISNEIEIFREENVDLSVKEQELASRYGEITSKMTVFFDGEEKTIQQLAPYLEKIDRSVREKAWRAMFERYAQDKDKLDELFDELKKIRVQMAKNAGSKNYRDYMHKLKGRFAYTPEDLLAFHDAVEKIFVPLIREFDEQRKEKLGVTVLRPWDMKAELEGVIPRPFLDHDDMIKKAIEAVGGVEGKFAKELMDMQEAGFIDAENRKGKAPGGYCYPLYEYGSSFIFMHAVGVRRDVETIVHEAGHAMHNLFCKEQEIMQYCITPHEVAELASMSMELMTLPSWHVFYDDKFLKKISKRALMDKIYTLPWAVTVDAFQHWIYLNPDHSITQRGEYFSSLLDRFAIGGDWNDLEKEKAMRWMMQLHIFEVPFYYIEYAIAQLGALGIYRNFLDSSQNAVEKYKKFLSLGYTCPVDEIYETAGVPFDFSVGHLEQIADFVRKQVFE